LQPSCNCVNNAVYPALLQDFQGCVDSLPILSDSDLDDHGTPRLLAQVTSHASRPVMTLSQVTSHLCARHCSRFELQLLVRYEALSAKVSAAERATHDEQSHACILLSIRGSSYFAG
jgi:hypothetical protein